MRNIPLVALALALWSSNASAAQGLRTVYLNFDGVTLNRSTTVDDATVNVSSIVNSATEVIPAMTTSGLIDVGGLSRQQVIDRVLADLEAIFEPYHVDFVTSRPVSAPYPMIVFGGDSLTVTGSAGLSGIALSDCDDTMPSNIIFVFPSGLRVGDLAEIAAEESAHAFGLGHTIDTSDIMFPVIQVAIPTAFGSGTIPDGSGCPPSATSQDSHATLLSIIGGRPDASVPALTGPAAVLLMTVLIVHGVRAAGG